MMKKLTIGFLFSTVLLVVSEYFFLDELFSDKSVFVIIASLIGLVVASLSFLYFFARYRKALKDS